MIAVASGKGGVGKTWLAITLAHALARLGRRTLLFDGDLGLANVDIQLGPDAGARPRRRARRPAVAGAGGAAVRCRRLRHRRRPLRLRPPRRRAAGAAGDARATSWSATAAHYDHVILDLGAGIERTVRQLARLAGSCIVVTTDEPTSLTDAYAFIKVTHLERRPGGHAGSSSTWRTRRATARRPTARCSAPASPSSRSRRSCSASSGATPRCAKPSATRAAC